MKNIEKEEGITFLINKKVHSEKEYNFTAKDIQFGLELRANLFIKPASIFLKDCENSKEEIFICQDITFNKKFYPSPFQEKHIVRLISHSLGELYRFSIFNQLSGVLHLIKQGEISKLTDIQQNWMKDFKELFNFVEFAENRLNLYMPTTMGTFQLYCEINNLLENSINKEIKNPIKTKEYPPMGSIAFGT